MGTLLGVHPIVPWDLWIVLLKDECLYIHTLEVAVEHLDDKNVKVNLLDDVKHVKPLL